LPRVAVTRIIRAYAITKGAAKIDPKAGVGEDGIGENRVLTGKISAEHSIQAVKGNRVPRTSDYPANRIVASAEQKNPV